MTDFLIVHEVGQSAWFWNKVWGSVTAPDEHPPKLSNPKYSSQFYLLNLPGHGDDEKGDTGEVRLDECVQAITRAVERRGMRNLVIVGHGVGGMIVLQAVPLLPEPPLRLALIAGVIPEQNRNPLSQLPGSVRRRFSKGLSLGKLSGNDLRLSRSFIARYLCNGIEEKEVTKALGFFGPLPFRMLQSNVDLPLSEIPCPISYVILDRDRLLPPTHQVAMARMLPQVDILHLDSCHQASLHKPVEMGQLLLDLPV